MNTYIYLVRHGEVSNPKNIFYGRLPRIGLSEEGKKTIDQSANFIKNIDNKILFSSPLLRTRQSSKIIKNKSNIEKVLITSFINEVNSYMEGMPFYLGKETRFDHYFSTNRKPHNETMEGIANRMTKFIKKTSLRYPGKNIIVVSHGDPIMILSALIKDLPLELDSIRSGKVRYIDYGEVLRIHVKDGIAKSIESVFVPANEII